MTGPDLPRRPLTELVGTGLLVTVIVGSGIAAQQRSPGQAGLQLLENSTTTLLGLAVLILLFGPVSGGHFNTIVSAVDWLLGRHADTGLPGREVLAYTGTQLVGAVGGAVLANVMFGLPAVQVSRQPRTSAGLWVGEMVATAGLITLIVVLTRTGRTALSAAAVGAGIAPASVPGFVLALSIAHLMRRMRPRRPTTLGARAAHRARRHRRDHPEDRKLSDLRKPERSLKIFGNSG